ncbi:hypothetical protein [Candidatus Epulonipiscium viviparus]|nr:hypothetical protein [Candidatus Epulopiscium viviparus]
MASEEASSITMASAEEASSKTTEHGEASSITMASADGASSITTVSVG